MPNSSDIKIAVVGYGYWGPNLLRNFSACNGFEVVALCEPNRDSQKKAKANYPNLHLYNSMEEMLKSEKLDAVAIASPPQTHYSLCEQAIEAGCHILVEKPLCNSSSDCLKILELADQKNLKVMVDHTYCHHEAIKYLNGLVRSDELGAITYYDSVRINLGRFQQTNVLWDLAPHDLSILLMLLDGELPSLVSSVGVAAHPNEPIAVCHSTLQYPSGLLAHLHLNWFSPVKVRSIIVGGQKKMAIFDELEPAESVKIYDRGVEIDRRIGGDPRINYRMGEMRSPALNVREALQNVAHTFHRYIVDKADPITDGIMGLKVIQILEALQKSAENQGVPVSLDEKSGLSKVA